MCVCGYVCICIYRGCECLCVSAYVCTRVCLCGFVCAEGQQQRKDMWGYGKVSNVALCVCMYIYIYMHTYIYTYIHTHHTYIHRFAEPEEKEEVDDAADDNNGGRAKITTRSGIVNQLRAVSVR
jgi:hypothetical protein